MVSWPLSRMNHSYAHVKHVDDLGKKFVKEFEETLFITMN